MSTEYSYRKQKPIGIDHPAYQGNRELLQEQNIAERDGAKYADNILGASIPSLHKNIEQLKAQLQTASNERVEGVELLIEVLNKGIFSEIQHLIDAVNSRKYSEHYSLVFNFFLSVLRSQEVRQHPVVQSWLKDPKASPQSIARIMQNDFAQLPQDLQELTLTTHADQIAVEHARFQERVIQYMEEFQNRAVAYVREHQLDIDEQLIAERLQFLVFDSGDLMRAPLSDTMCFGAYQQYQDRIMIFLNPMLLGISDDTEPSRARALEEEKSTVMHELVHAVISGQRPFVRISGSVENSVEIDRMITEDMASSDPEMFGPEGLIYDPLAEAGAVIDYLSTKEGLSFIGTPNRDLEWLNEAITVDIHNALFPEDIALNQNHKEETGLYAVFKKVIPEELFLKAYTENTRQESVTTVSSPVHTKALLRAINEAFAPGLYVRLQRYIHTHSINDALDMMQAGRWREELFPSKKV